MEKEVVIDGKVITLEVFLGIDSSLISQVKIIFIVLWELFSEELIVV